MIIIGADYHPAFQRIGFVDTETGELQERRLENRETSGTPAVKPGSRPAGEGLGHTARVYVSEESHSGIVPLNHSNKDRTSLAESEEGRLLIEENTLPSGTYPTLSGSAPPAS